MQDVHLPSTRTRLSRLSRTSKGSFGSAEHLARKWRPMLRIQ